MTPEEQKAKELVEKYDKLDAQLDGADIFFHDSKACALIAVDEILLHNPLPINPDENETAFIKYWQSVKQSIQEL